MALQNPVKHCVLYLQLRLHLGSFKDLFIVDPNFETLLPLLYKLQYVTLVQLNYGDTQEGIQSDTLSVSTD